MKKRRILSLRPTQFAVGMEEVKAKLRQLERLGGGQLAKYLKKHPVKVLRAPGKELYVLDHHHELAAVWLVGVKKVFLDVHKNLSGRSVADGVLAFHVDTPSRASLRSIWRRTA
jgi:hypothetical protein